MSVLSLTTWEWRALEGRVNLADGHARQLLAGHEEALIEKLPLIYRESYVVAQREAEQRFLKAYGPFVGINVDFDYYRPLFHYSSSVSIDAVAKFVGARSMPTTLIWPTFDNIPAILKRNRVSLRPVSEEEIVRSTDSFENSNGALFLVNPNNPTGTFLTAQQFGRIAELCARSGTVLITDNSFRAFRPLTSYDDLAMLRQTKCSFISIEDTGKIFSTNDIKVGFLLCSENLHAELAAASDEIMLNVSPFALLLLEAVCHEVLRRGGRGQVLSLVEANRCVLEKALLGSPIRVAPSRSPIGVAWAELPRTWNGQEFAGWLGGQNLGLLPGNAFYWNNPALGDHFIRIALMRDEKYFGKAVDMLAGLALRYRP